MGFDNRFKIHSIVVSFLRNEIMTNMKIPKSKCKYPISDTRIVCANRDGGGRRQRTFLSQEQLS